MMAGVNVSRTRGLDANTVGLFSGSRRKRVQITTTECWQARRPGSRGKRKLSMAETGGMCAEYVAGTGKSRNARAATRRDGGRRGDVGRAGPMAVYGKVISGDT